MGSRMSHISQSRYPRHVLCAASAVAFGVFIGPAAEAQQQLTRAYVVPACGTPPQNYPAGSQQNVLMDTTGRLCDSISSSGTISVTISGALPPYAATPLGYFQTTGFTTAVGLPSIPAGAICALVTIETNAARFRDDGTAPTSGIGFPLAATQTVSLCEVSGTPGLAGVQFIPESGASTLDVLYYR